jgi:signal transduction histidine kinase
VTIENGPAESVPALSGAGGGHGLAGLRQRAALAGGQFSAGPAEGGGWRVRAVFPAGGGA